jgi:hypothetical protein
MHVASSYKFFSNQPRTMTTKEFCPRQVTGTLTVQCSAGSIFGGGIPHTVHSSREYYLVDSAGRYHSVGSLKAATNNLVVSGPDEVHRVQFQSGHIMQHVIPREETLNYAGNLRRSHRKAIQRGTCTADTVLRAWLEHHVFFGCSTLADTTKRFQYNLKSQALRVAQQRKFQAELKRAS